ncbi:MAG: ATP-binding protein [Alphaproteobacteria bacterium]
MTAGPSLHRRLGLWLTAGILLMWLAATAAAGFVLRHEMDEVFDSALQETAQRLLPLAVRQVTDTDAGGEARMEAILPHREYLTYLVRSPDGRVLLRSHDAETGHFPGPPSTGFRDTADHRIYGEKAVSGTVVIEVAEPLEHRREAAMESMLSLLVPLPFLIPASILAIWAFLRRAMRPLARLRAEIEDRGGGNLSPIAAPGLYAEMASIGESVNRLLDRLRRALDAERSFAASSAHELRTPIAGALAQTQRLVADAPTADVRDRGLAIEAALQRLARLSEKLLQLARAEGGVALAERVQDLYPILVHLVDEFQRRREDGGRLRFAASAGPLQGRMDPDAFAVLVRNLIENALRHSPPGSAVDIRIADAGTVHVVNAGLPVPPATLARIRQPFQRGAAGVQGSGLGLAIADRIAQAAGATLDLHSPALGREDGFEAVLRMPVA